MTSLSKLGRIGPIGLACGRLSAAGMALALCAAGAALSGCANGGEADGQKSAHVSQGSLAERRAAAPFSVPNRPADDPLSILADYDAFNGALAAAKSGDDLAAQAFVQSGDNAMTEDVAKAWAISMAKRREFTLFSSALAKISSEAANADKELLCAMEYGRVFSTKGHSPQARTLAESNEPLPALCNDLIAWGVGAGQVPAHLAFKRVLVNLSAGQRREAETLARALGFSLDDPNGDAALPPSVAQFAQAAREIAPIVTPKGRNSPAAEEFIARSDVSTIPIRGLPNPYAFAYGALGLSKAKDLNPAAALRLYGFADPYAMSDEQFEWRARSALRLQNWNALSRAIDGMPPRLRSKPAWLYWKAECLRRLGFGAQASALYAQAADSGRNYYALLAADAIGRSLPFADAAPKPAARESNAVLADGAVMRALTLFRASIERSDRAMRTAAQRQWRYAMRPYGDAALIAASAAAERAGFHEMSIYSADKADGLLVFSLRYPAPFRDLVEKWSRAHGVRPDWVYGVIRQESRFMYNARSRAGAQGLMQVMPGTAKLIARKIGLSGYDPHDMDVNVRMGTWYLGDVEAKLGHEALATAGYNAGPNRARRWQADVPMDATIYAETIPFDETREYVKNVMANAAYYAAVFSGTPPTLRSRMGVAPAREPARGDEF